MKKVVLISVMILMGASAMAQKYGFVDTDYIRKNIPAFEAAQQKLDEMSKVWEAEVTVGYEEVEKLYKAYQNESVLLSNDMKAKREEAIINKERAVKELQNKYFGVEGELYKKRDEMVQPLQDEILKAIKEIALEGGYAAVFDTAAGMNILFANPKFDVSDQVLQKLGYKN